MKKLKTPCSLPLGKATHVRLECINNQFGIYYNGELKMAVCIKDYTAKPNYWYLIGWNGIKELDGDQSMHMDWEIRNFKILHQRKVPCVIYSQKQTICNRKKFLRTK